MFECLGTYIGGWGMPTRHTAHRALAVIAGFVVSAIALTGCSPDRHVEIAAPAQVDAPLPQETVQRLEEAVTHAMAATGSSGAIVGVWVPWSGTWVTGLGAQHPDGSGPVTTDLQFRAGKVTRAMTCDVLYQVAAEGTVKLSDSVSQYVAGVPDLADVTLEQLCDSSSGLGSFTDALYASWLTNPGRKWDPRYLASFGLGQARTTEPGAAYRDSDAGYFLLGLALERATGKSAADLIAQYVADPLDLTATSLGALDPAVALAGGQSMSAGDGQVDCAQPLDLTEASATIGYTDAGVVTDIDDLGRYVQALASSSLVKSEDRLAGALPAASSAPSWYTMGGGTVQAGTLVGQFGKVPGYITAAFADRESGLAVAVVLNNSAAAGGVGAYLAWELAAIASKAPAAGGEAVPEAGLPWTAEQYHEAIAKAAVACAVPAE